MITETGARGAFRRMIGQLIDKLPQVGVQLLVLLDHQVDLIVALETEHDVTQQDAVDGE